MGDLSEVEIFSCMAENLRLAAQHCADLAVKPLKGPIYNDFRKELRLVEGCCKQASQWREDTRWLPIGLMMAECHKRAGDWLRGVKDPVTGRRVKIAEGQRHPLFLKLAENLRAIHREVEKLRAARTGRIGMILPELQPAPTRTQGRQMQVILPPGMHQTRSGLIIPDGVSAQ